MRLTEKVIHHTPRIALSLSWLAALLEMLPYGTERACPMSIFCVSMLGANLMHPSYVQVD